MKKKGKLEDMQLSSYKKPILLYKSKNNKLSGKHRYSTRRRSDDKDKLVIEHYFWLEICWSIRESICLKISFHSCSWMWCTVAEDWESSKPCLCSKLALFKTSWQMFRVLLQLGSLVSYLLYLRAFKWGTVWPCT